MGKCGSCKYKGHCDTTSELYGVRKYNGGCQYYKDMNEQKKPQTNADRIRAMSDDELAEFLYHFYNHSRTYCVCNEDSCRKGGLQWLKSEAKE